jgi:hypothetical protein
MADANEARRSETPAVPLTRPHERAARRRRARARRRAAAGQRRQRGRRRERERGGGRGRGGCGSSECRHRGHGGHRGGPEVALDQEIVEVPCVIGVCLGERGRGVLGLSGAVLLPTMAAASGHECEASRPQGPAPSPSRGPHPASGWRRARRRARSCSRGRRRRRTRRCSCPTLARPAGRRRPTPAGSRCAGCAQISGGLGSRPRRRRSPAEGRAPRCQARRRRGRRRRARGCCCRLGGGRAGDAWRGTGRV